MTDKYDKYAIVGMAVWPCHILKTINGTSTIGCNCDGIICQESVDLKDVYMSELAARAELADRLEYFTKLNNYNIKRAGESAGEKK